MHRLCKLTIITLLLLHSLGVKAEIRLPSLISDHMVLQQGKAARVWGWASPGEAVTVRFADQELQSTANKDGRWEVLFGPLATGLQGDMAIEGSNRLVVHDVLVGEVWLASGQSNMERPLHFVMNYEAVAAQAANPQIRLFLVSHAIAASPAEDVKGRWALASSNSVRSFSGAAYFYAKELQAAHNVPVGIIESAFGGTPIEAWMSNELLKSDPAFAFVAQNWNKHLADMPRLNAQYQHNLEVWKSRFTEEDRKAFAAGKAPPGAPLEPQGAGSRAEPFALWNGMIVPIAPYTVRGVLWYQGENNANATDAFVYRSLFTAMIRSWRSTWGEGDLPFIYVQLSRYKYGSNYAVLRESQTQALVLPNTAMVVSVDAGMIDDVHYPDKAPIGHRLFLAADRLVYGSHNPAEGPKLSKVEAKQDALRLTFTSTEGGLKLSAPGIPRYAQLMPDTPATDQADGKAVVYRQPSEEELKSAFLIAGKEGVFYPAAPELDGPSLILRKTAVRSPVSVCYAWRDDAPAVVLWNGAGLPASPFRTSIRSGELPNCPGSSPPK